MKSKTQEYYSQFPPLQVAQANEVEASSQQLMMLRNMIERQHSAFLSQTAIQDLLLERIINKLSLVSQSTLVSDIKDADWHSGIQFCIKEIEMMLENHERIKKEWQMAMKELFKQTSVDMHPELQLEHNNENLFAFQPEGQDEFVCGRMNQLQNLEEEIQKLDKKYEEIQQQNKNIKQQYNNLSVLYSQSIQKSQEFQCKLRQLSQQNTMLTKQLIDIKNELRKYRQSSKRAYANQLELNKIIYEHQKEIYKACEEAQRLNLQVISFQLKFKEIVEHEDRKKIVSDCRLKRQDSKILCEIPTQNTIDSIQSKASKKQLEKIRKFNILSIQQKLSNYKFLG